MTLTPADFRAFERWGRSHYDPHTGELVMIGNPPPYVWAHERQHQRQHRDGTLLYLLWSFVGSVQPFSVFHLPFRLARRATRLLLEIDADLRARAEMRRAGLWNTQNQKAAQLVMRSYLCPASLNPPR